MNIKLLILSIIISIISILTKNIYPSLYVGNYKINMFNKIDIILLILFTYIIYQTFMFIRKHKHKFKKENKILKKYITYKNIYLSVLFVYIINFFVTYTDTFMVTTETIWMNAINGTVSNSNPLINTFIMKPGLWLYDMTGNHFYGLLLNRIILYIFSIVVYSILNCYIWKKSKNAKYLLFSFVWTMFLPIIFTFQSFLWKDTYFVNFSILFTIFLYEIIDTNFKILKNKIFDISFILISVIMILIRNNVIIPFVILFIVSVICYKKVSKKFVLLLSIILIIYLVLSNIVFPKYYVNDVSKVEFAGSKLSFISRIISNNLEIDSSDKQFINNIIDSEQIIKKYNPNCIDSIKFSTYFNDKFFNDNYNKFNKIVFKYIKKYPIEFLKTYIVSSYQMWSLYTPDPTAGHIWYYMTKTPILNLITCPIIYIFLFLYLMYKYRKRLYWMLFIFILMVYVTLIIGVPINISIRYIYIIFPNFVILLLPLITKKIII